MQCRERVGGQPGVQPPASPGAPGREVHIPSCTLSPPEAAHRGLVAHGSCSGDRRASRPLGSRSFSSVAPKEREASSHLPIHSPSLSPLSYLREGRKDLWGSTRPLPCSIAPRISSRMSSHSVSLSVCLPVSVYPPCASSGSSSAHSPAGHSLFPPYYYRQCLHPTLSLRL